MSSLILTLPVPNAKNLPGIERILPKDLFPGGVRTLAVNAFANPDDFGSYVTEAWAEIFDWGYEYSEDPRMIRHQRKLEHNAFRGHLEWLMTMYYDDFWLLNKPILQGEEFTVKEVLNYDAVGAIRMKVERGRTPRYPHCPGF